MILCRVSSIDSKMVSLFCCGQQVTLLLVAVYFGAFVRQAQGVSCENKCGAFLGNQSPCQCNTQCSRFNDCCEDYPAVCLGMTCSNRCGTNVDTSSPCQCNEHCTRFNDCCPDYQSLCVDQAGSGPTCLSTQEISELMWANDVNGVRAQEVMVNFQSQIPASNSAPDASPDRLFTSLDESRLQSGTYPSYLALLDNYNPHRGVLETDTPEHLAEEDLFLSAILDTPVMQILLDYAQCRGWVTDRAGLRQRLVQAWFEEYPRSGSSTVPDTNGFEHVMVGEYKSSTEVTGFHNWLAFYDYERRGQLNYFGFVSQRNPNIIGAGFNWNGRYKSLGSFIIGASPELDLALYSLAFWHAPDGTTDVSLGGNSRQIISFSKDNHVATAFVAL